MVKDSSFDKVRKFNKFKDCIDTTALECNLAFWGAISFVFILYFSINNNEIDVVNSIFITLTKDIAIALIGFLGFTVSGLAILTGVISQKVVQKVISTNKKDHLEKILLSFYFLGIVIGVVIVGLFLLYLISSSSLDFDIRWVIAIALIFSYFVIFIIFYSVKLIGNCLEIFFIVNEAEPELKKNADVNQLYNSYKLMALEKVCLERMDLEAVKEYCSTIQELIDASIPEEQEELKKRFEEHFNTNS